MITTPRSESYLGQYLKHYERERYTFLERFLPTIIIQPDAEQFADLSFYQAGTNWTTYAAHARAVILRIGQNVWQDSEFETFYTAARAQHLAIGGYYFFDDRATPQAQADVIIRAMSGKYLDMELYIDWERIFGGAYGGLPNVVKLMQLVEMAGVKCKAVGMYTGYYWFVEHSNATTNGAQYIYLKQRPLWLAWYAAASLVRVPFPWQDWTHWQYGTPAVAWGQSTQEIDLNKHNGTKAQFEQRYLGSSIPADVTTYPFPNQPGVKQIAGTRNGWKFWIHVIDPGAMRYRVVNNATVATVSATAKSCGASFGWNGSDYDRITHALHIGAPSFYSDGRVQNDTGGDVFALRPLIVNGVLVDMSSGEAKWTEGHSRTIVGKDASGRVMLWTSEGAYPNQGLTFKECATVLQSYGAVLAGDLGGGGDTTLYVNGVVLNTPEDMSNGIHYERKIPQVLLGYVDGTTPSNDGGIMYAGTTSASPTKIWDRVGGQVIKELQSGVKVRGEAPRADGYVLLASPVVGYTKRAMLTGYVLEATTPTPTPPPATGTPFTLSVDGYKPFSGTLEKA